MIPELSDTAILLGISRDYYDCIRPSFKPNRPN
jgi:hypothetical protein